MINDALQKITNNQELNFNETKSVMDEIMTGQIDQIQITSLLTALAVKNETVEEIAGAAESIRNKAINFPKQPQALDIVGTGGDHSNSFNISSTASIIIASLGYDVVKHGNRAASSKSGAADVLEALKFPINQSVEASAKMLEKYHYTFLFAQKYHQAMKYVAPVRNKLSIHTIFNILGPLLNPAHPQNMVLGVYDEKLLEPMARVLDQLGVKSANIIYGTDGFDEASISAPTKLVTLRNGQTNGHIITPKQFGLSPASKAQIIGGSAEDNANITKKILAGSLGPKRDVVVLNAAIGINAIDHSISINKGITMAQKSIDSGKAANLLIKITAKEEAK